MVVLSSTINAFAIEGLQLSLQCSNVVLTWPSIEYRNYIVQYRPTLDPSTPWQTLTSSLPADFGTNLTFFVHSNVVQFPNCDSGGSFAAMSGGGVSELEVAASVLLEVPLAMPANGTGNAVPLSLYPPGFDLSNYLIWDPSIDEWISGLGVSSLESESGIEPPGDPQEGGSTTNFPPVEAAFYQVVEDGVQILNSSITNLTNGVLSGTVAVGCEAGNADANGIDVKGNLACAVLLVDGEKFIGDGVLGVPPGHPWQFSLDTGYLENGDHTL